jgi:hypothetical protein
MKYRKKPLVIEAIQWTGENLEEVCEFVPAVELFMHDGSLIISRGDYIIKGIKGEYYPCSSDVFEMTYEAVIEA